MMQTDVKDTCASVTVSALSLKYDNGGQNNANNDANCCKRYLCQCDSVSLVSRGCSLENWALPEQRLTTCLRITMMILIVIDN